MRALLLLASIVLVLLVGWAAWPGSEPRPVPQPPDATDAPTAPRIAGGAAIEADPGAAERSLAAPVAAEPAASARLLVRCVARADGRPLAGVEVRVGAGEPRFTSTEGRIAFEVEPGRPFVVRAQDLERFVSRETAEVSALAPGETREIVLRHESGETDRFCGLVVARADGAPIADAEVRVGEAPRARTDAQGRFELDFAAHLTPSVRIDARGFGPAVVGAVRGHETPAWARRVELERAGALEIALQVPPGQLDVHVVLDAKGHQISQDAAFTTDVSAPPLRWRADADTQGVCRFADLPPRVGLDAEVIGSAGVLFRPAEPIVLEPGESRRLAWDLRGCDLVGHVYEADGRPAAGIPLALMQAETGRRRYEFEPRAEDVVARAMSADDGSYRFASVAAGTWILSPHSAPRAAGTTPADAIAPVPHELTIEAGEAQHVVDIRIERGLYIRGTLVAPDGKSGVLGHVRARAADGALAEIYTEAKGEFALGPLARGTYVVVGSPYDHLDSAPVEIEAGAPPLVLRSRPGAEVAGRVIDQGGTGMLASITIGGPGGSMTMMRTQPDGSFRLGGLEAGSYTLVATTSGGQAGELAGVALAPAAPVADLQIVLGPGARLRARSAGGRVGRFHLQRDGATIGVDELLPGRTLMQVVPPGKVRVELRFPGVDLPEVRELDLAAGEEREIVFEAPAGG